jgi:membrane-associated phospholipid phosphatase
VVTHFWLKTIGTTVFISLFFVAYFRVLNFPIFPVTVMPLTVLDAWTPFIPLTLVLYLSLWAYVPLAPLLQPEKTSLYAVGWEAGGVALVGLGIFIFHPTAVPVPAIDWSQHPGFGFLKTVDASGNACPSLHVAFAVFAAIRVQAVLRDTRSRASLHVMNWAWCVAIAYSTLATKQHVAVDVFAGAALGVAGGMVRWATPLVCRLRGVSAI